ncbi:THO complex subunit 2, partial [Ascosphaera atra]
MPDNMIYLAALLIKVGFISLRDLYPHLWRPDEKMDALKEEKMKEKAAREKAMRPGAGAMNALMMSGALGDDTAPAPRGLSAPGADAESRASATATPAAEEKTEKDEANEPEEQKVLLLKSLLAIGAVPEALYILGKFPWLLDAYPELPEFIHRIIHHCLGKVYAAAAPPSLEQARRQKKIASPGVKGALNLTDAPPRRVLRWAQLDRDDEADDTSYRFYWDDWADNIPVCQTVDDVFALCDTFLNLSGVKIGRDPSLLIKFARIGKASLRDDASETNRARWRDLCKRILVPALSLTDKNPGVVNEVYDLLSFFPRDVRYAIYAEWYSGQTSRLPDIKSAFDQARAETKDALKRLSKTNIRPMARTLAKIAFANPGIVINTAVTQIEAYENLIEVVVECARYFTYLGYDILTWSLINSLGAKGRSRVQQGGLFTSRWLNSLASFAGRVFKRYSSIMDPVPLLQYVADQLARNNSTDLIVLEQLISSMAGIVTDSNFNDSQIQAMAGGDLLRAQTMLQLLDKRHESKTTSRRLLRSLTESKLAGQLLVSIAQERLTCIFKATDEAADELKLLGNIFDEIHRVLTQYLDLLRSNLTVEEFDTFVPDAPALISQFGLPHEVAFWIARPSIAHRMVVYDERKREESEAKGEKEGGQAQPKQEEDVEMIDEGEMKEEDAEMKDVPQTSEKGSSSTETKDTPSDGPPWHPVLSDLMAQLKTTLPASCWETVGLPFFATFWQLSLYDLHIPQKQYEEEMERQSKRVTAITNDRSDVSMAGTQRKEKEKKALHDLRDRILAECKAHLRSYGETRARLNKEKDHWFADMRGKHNPLNIAILEQCLLPRVLLSPTDAFYSFKMLKYLHSSGAACFRTMGLLDQLFKDQRLTAIIFQCTSKEADNFGHFLSEVLKDLGRWHADRNVYEKEAYGTKKDLPGLAKSVQQDGKPVVFLDYEDFRHLLFKWHRLFFVALKTCLTSGEYMHIRNAISIMKAVAHSFPAVTWMGTEMRNMVNSLKTTDSRDDVKIPAASLIGDLNRRESKWISPGNFHLDPAAVEKKAQKPAPPITQAAQ